MKTSHLLSILLLCVLGCSCQSPIVFAPEKIWQLAIAYAKESLWAEEGAYKGFSIGLLPDSNGVGLTCLDTWANHAVLPMELLRLTHDPQWQEKALAIWRNGCQLISDGTLEINGMLRPTGSQNEAYFQCNWNFNYESGEQERINQWLVAWPSAFRLETLRRLPDWNTLK